MFHKGGGLPLALLVALGIALLFSFPAVMLRPMDAISVGWLLAALVLLSLVVFELLRTLLRTFCYGAAASFDIAFGVVFLALPISGGLLVSIVWNLAQYVLWWTSLP